MNPPPIAAPPILNPALPQSRTLRRLFLKLYLRGRSSRGLRPKTAPKSVVRKLIVALAIYTIIGGSACSFIHKPVFALAIFLHGLTFVFLGMFVSSSSGEVLFNKEEADILLHRPITPRDLLWAKIRVLIEVSLWLAGALNLVGLVAGVYASDGGILFPLIHIVSTTLEALFCTSCIVLAYQLCLRWFGRERLDTLMTTTQVLVAVTAVAAGQILPRLVIRFSGLLRFGPQTWWMALFPPGWFAGMDDAVAGQHAPGSWLLAAFGFVATALTCWLAFGKLAHSYEAGLQLLGETVSRPRRASKPRWAEVLAKLPPVKWFSPISRAGFLLTTAYLVRDRDVKLRVFPGIAPMLILPFVFLVQDRQVGEGYGFAFSACFLATLPLITLDLLQYSQQWQASDIFRVAPMNGPAELSAGARRAVICVLAVPAFVLVAFIFWVIQHNASHLLLLLPGLLLLPVVALVPALMRRGVPFCLPNEEAKSAGRGLKMILVMLPAGLLSYLASHAFSAGWFTWFILGEVMIMIPLYFGLRAIVSKRAWRPIEYSPRRIFIRAVSRPRAQYADPAPAKSGRLG